MFRKKPPSPPQTDSERNLAAATANGSAVLTATGVAVSAGLMGVAAAQAAKVTTAMHTALQAAQAEGVTDPDELRKRMLIARDQVRGGA